MLETGEMPKERMNQILDKHLTRDADRALFGLQPRKEAQEKETTQQVEMSGA